MRLAFLPRMYAFVDDLAFNRARIEGSRTTSLCVVDLGMTVAVPCREQVRRSMGIEVMAASSGIIVEAMRVRSAGIRTGEAA